MDWESDKEGETLTPLMVLENTLGTQTILHEKKSK